MNIAAARSLALKIRVRGVVQGVGFRPFVYRLAKQSGLVGRISNTSDGVAIEVEGRDDEIQSFLEKLRTDKPTAAVITEIVCDPSTSRGEQDFTIEASEWSTELAARIPYDLAICQACWEDLRQTGNRRQDDPFTSCTACGPRYSIIHSMPFDRLQTSMASFPLCDVCSAEYDQPVDRRFHAQTICCIRCGPRIALLDANGRRWDDGADPIAVARSLLCCGKILAVKGLGGYQLLVRADDPDRVMQLRDRKQRPSKPLAVMVPNLDFAEQLAHLNDLERQLLASPRNPIVIVRQRSGQLPEAIAPGLHDVGLFLPTTPLHELLVSDLGFPVVATSANRSHEPIVITEEEACRSLNGIADAYLVHNREIVRGLDDSVVKVINGRTVGIRLSRGYCPLPLPNLEKQSCPMMAALGGQKKPTIAVWNGIQAVLGQHLSETGSIAGRERYQEVFADLLELYQSKPESLVCDLHPDYDSTHFTAQSDLPCLRVQHHHAHAAAAMAEHDLLDREVLAFVWDGTGYGPDGTIWGGETLHVRGATYDRVASLRLLPLPGGEAAIRHPNRIAWCMLTDVLRDNVRLEDWQHRLGITTREADLLSGMMKSQVRVAWSSSVGRLFDAIACLILPSGTVTYEGELAMRLEALADPVVEDAYAMPCIVDETEPTLVRGDWGPLVEQVVTDLEGKVPASVVSARFQNTLIQWGVAVSERNPDLPVILAGGCFQNRHLTESMARALYRAGRTCHTPGLIPPGDGGLAVGQLAVAMMSVATT